MQQRDYRVQRTWVVAMGALMLLTGCRQEDPIARGAREYRARHQSLMEQARNATERSQLLPDDQLVRLNVRDGMGIGMRLDKTDLHVGEPLRIHLVYENFGTETPISATTCQGFSLGSEDEDTLVATSVAVRLSCPDEDINRDNDVPLPQSQLQRATVTTEGTRLTFDHPGLYILVAGWQAFRPREGIFLRPDSYSVVASNKVLITVH